jgi:hypothetical protein
MERELTWWTSQWDMGGDGARVRRELWALLARKAEILSLGDSSIREEQAEELLRSLCYTISMALEPLDGAAARERLLSYPISALYREGEKRLARRLARARAAYGRVLEEALPLDNLAYQDTLKNLGGFFSAYRPDLFASDIPCMIDYPQVIEARGQGVAYIEQYLAEWAREDGFLSRFPLERITRLLDAHFPDARAQVVNLFEPVAAGALGLTLLGEDPAGLFVDWEGQGRLWEAMRGLGAEAFRAKLLDAVEALVRRTGADGAPLRAVAEELAARIPLLPAEGMGGIFTA